MGCTVQQFRMVWRGVCITIVNEGVADGRKKEGRREKKICLQRVGAGWWWLGGHENVNPDVSEAIY